MTEPLTLEMFREVKFMADKHAATPEGRLHRILVSKLLWPSFLRAIKKHFSESDETDVPLPISHVVLYGIRIEESTDFHPRLVPLDKNGEIIPELFKSQ